MPYKSDAGFSKVFEASNQIAIMVNPWRWFDVNQSLDTATEDDRYLAVEYARDAFSEALDDYDEIQALLAASLNQ